MTDTMAAPVEITAARPASPAPRPRWDSIDIARGYAIVAMVLIDMAGSGAIPGPLHHARYNGFTYADTIFPLFLLLVGVSMTLTGRRSTFRPVATRAVKLVAISSVLIAFKYDHWFNLDTGVLQQIAVAFFCTWLLLRLPVRVQRIVVAGLVLGVAAAYLWLPGGGVLPGKFVSGRTIGDAFDRWMHSDGLHAYLPSIASVYAGVEVGRVLTRSAGRTARRSLLARLAALGGALTTAGLLMSFVVPLNKHLWTPSFVLVAAGLATFAVLLCQVVVSAVGPRWFAPLALVGRNAIVVYIFDELAMRELRNTLWPLAQAPLEGAIGVVATSFVFPTFAIAMCVGVCALMERHHLRLRL